MKAEINPLFAARLRDVLSDETIAKIWKSGDDVSAAHELNASDDWTADNPEAAREAIIATMLPLLSSLLEEREREIRDLQLALSKCEGRLESAREGYESRLASSSSPAAPQEK